MPFISFQMSNRLINQTIGSHSCVRTVHDKQVTGGPRSQIDPQWHNTHAANVCSSHVVVRESVSSTKEDLTNLHAEMEKRIKPRINESIDL